MSTLVLEEGANASPHANEMRAFNLVLPALAAIAYPLLLSAIAELLGFFGSPRRPVRRRLSSLF